MVLPDEESIILKVHDATIQLVNQSTYGSDFIEYYVCYGRYGVIAK